MSPPSEGSPPFSNACGGTMFSKTLHSLSAGVRFRFGMATDGEFDVGFRVTLRGRTPR